MLISSFMSLMQDDFLFCRFLLSLAAACYSSVLLLRIDYLKILEGWAGCPPTDSLFKCPQWLELGLNT